MAKTFWNIVKANAEISGADAAIDAALTAAKISTVTIEGKEVALADAPLAAKISALAGLDKSSEANAELLASNAAAAAKAEELTGQLATANTKISELTGKVATLDASVAELTGKNTELGTKVTALTGSVTAQNDLLTQACLAGNVLDLKDEKGNAFAKDEAGQKASLAAAVALPFETKFNAFKGAVNAAIAKTGASPVEIPAAPAAPVTDAKAALAQYNQITDPTARVEFYRKNRAAIDAAHRQ